MGLYDREYYREEPKGLNLASQWSMVTTLIVVNLAVFLVDQFSAGGTALSRFLSARADTIANPLDWWRLLSSGFAHADFSHVGWNMVGLYIFGRDLEDRYGRTEFLRFYLVSIVFASIAQGCFVYFGSDPANLQGMIKGGYTFLGASGGVMATMALCAFNFPQKRLMIWFVMPFPLWALALFYVAMDVSGVINQREHVAYAAHLGGAAFGAAYYQFNWHLSSYWPDFSRFWGGVRSKVRVGSRPNLKIHQPESTSSHEPADEAAVDRVLEKISREGESSLSDDERRILEEASRRYQRRRD